MSKINDPLPPVDTIFSIAPDYTNLVREYCQLAVRPTLCESEAERLEEILELAESESWLDFWLNEADHFLAHELDLTDRESIYVCENQQAKLREYIQYESTHQTNLELFEQLKQQLQASSKKLQQRLRKRGFDPGPIDGILGPRTQSAIIRFQKAHCLIADGIPDTKTQEALGLK
jgi:murein L,D-transpeptidase YcbB/YkuD